MAFPRWTLGACLALALGVAHVNQADQPQLTPQPGVLVLRTGRVLRGEISRVGDRYVVILGGKDEVGVPAESVELQCDTLEDAYQQKRHLLPEQCKAADHLALADWCLRYELMAPAAEQLIAAQQLEPDNPAVAVFERRLRMAAQQPSAPNTPAARSQPQVSQADLDQLVRGMPAGTVEQFTNTIQPLLINRCGTSGCHGPNGSSSFRLAYPNWSRTLPRRFTQRNLHTTMQHLDLDKPEDSPLLVMATSAHATCNGATLGDRDTEQLNQLVDWVRRCTTGRTPPTNLGSPDSLLLQPQVQPRSSATSGARAGAEAVPPRPAAARAPTTESADRAPTTTPSASRVTPATPADGSAAQDPFDPEAFNRRYGRRAK